MPGPECRKSHAAVGESLGSIIMEVWAPAPEASYFSVFVRIPERLLRPFLLHNVPEIYIDPRKDKKTATQDHLAAIAHAHTRQEWISKVIRWELNPLTCNWIRNNDLK